MHTPKAAAIYCRISMDRTGEGLGVDRQEAECQALAARKGWPVAQVFTDNDLSASDRKKKRPAYEAMLAAIEQGEVDAIICWHTDRLTRQTRQLEDVIDLAQKHGTAMATVQGDIDLSTPNGQMVARMLGAAARQEVDQKSLRQKAKNQQLAQAGLPRGGGGRPFGYEKDALALRTEEAVAVADATRRVIEGGSLASIMREWNAAGLVTTRGGQWTYPSMTALLTRWRNAGIVQVNGEPMEGIKAQWEPIVTPEELRTVRSVLHDPKRRTNKSGNAIKHVLSGIIRCDACNTDMRWGRTRTRAGRDYENYVCKNGLGRCRGGVIKDVAEDVVTTHVVQRLALPGLDLTETTAEDRARATALRHERAVLDDEQAQAGKANLPMHMKIMLLEDVENRRALLDRQIERLTQNNVLASLMSDLTTIKKGNTVRLLVMVDERAAVRQRYEALDLHQQRAIIKALMTVRVTKHEKGVRPTRESAARRVVITPLDPRTGEVLDDSYANHHQVGDERAPTPA